MVLEENFQKISFNSTAWLFCVVGFSKVSSNHQFIVKFIVLRVYKRAELLPSSQEPVNNTYTRVVHSGIHSIIDDNIPQQTYTRLTPPLLGLFIYTLPRMVHRQTTDLNPK